MYTWLDFNDENIFCPICSNTNLPNNIYLTNMTNNTFGKVSQKCQKSWFSDHLKICFGAPNNEFWGRQKIGINSGIFTILILFFFSRIRYNVSVSHQSFSASVSVWSFWRVTLFWGLTLVSVQRHCAQSVGCGV